MLNSTSSLQQILSSLGGLTDRQTRISQEMSSGLRITSLGDDPTAAGQAVTMADSLRQDEAFLSTASSATNRMQAADTALGSVVSQLTSAIGTATGALNDTGTSTSRAAAMQTLMGIRDSMLSLANSSYGGSYLFSGTGVTSPFTMDASGTVTYAGNAETTRVAMTSGSSVTTSVAGDSVFLATFGALNTVLTALQSGGSVDATSLVSGLHDALNTVITQRATLNASQSRLSGETDYITTQKANLQVQQSTLLSADTASLATELSAVTTQRSALLSTIAVVQKGSLFDYL